MLLLSLLLSTGVVPAETLESNAGGSEDVEVVSSVKKKPPTSSDTDTTKQSCESTSDDANKSCAIK